MADRTRIGDVDIMGLIDMEPPANPPTNFFRDTVAEDWDPYRAEYLEPNGTMQLYYGCFVLRSPGKTVLVDTGIGAGPFPTRENKRGELMDQLASHGLGPEDIDVVALTHLHPDHVGWNLTSEDGAIKATFPKAQYLVPRGDWDHFTQPKAMADNPYMAESVVPLEGLGIMELIDGEHSITPEITTLPTPGHTPGHVCIMVTSQGQKGLVTGDVLTTPVQVSETGWNGWVDIDKEQSARTREALVDRMEREGIVVAAGHFRPRQHFGRVVRLQGRRYWQAL